MTRSPILTLAPSETPDLKRLLEPIIQCIDDSGPYWDRMRQAQEVQFCEWDGQSADGRLWAARLGREPFPWDGAHDLRVRLCNEVVDETKARLTNAFRRAEIQAVAHQSRGIEASAKATSTMRWMLHTQMQPALGQEIDLAADWMLSYGSTVLHVCWETETRLIPQTLTLEDLVGQAMQAMADQIDPQDPQAQEQAMAQAVASVEEFRSSLFDPAQLNGLAVSMKETLMPHLTVPQVRAVLADIRDEGRGVWPAPERTRSQPVWTALRPLVDVFFPLSTGDLTRAPWVARSAWYTEDELRDRVRTDGWNAEWVQACVDKHLGREWHGSLQAIREDLETPGQEGMPRGAWHALDRVQREGLCEVLHVYHRAVDRRGFPHVMETVLHGAMEDRPAVSRPLPYDHGLMPFVGLRRETKTRALIDSRGIPDLLLTHQAEMKHQRDRRADRSDLTTLPPVVVPGDRGGGRYPFRPGSQIPARRGMSPEFMRFPELDRTSMEVEAQVRADVDRLFGRWSEAVPQPVSVEMQQAEVDNWLRGLAQAGAQTWALAQQYLDPVVVARVAGDEAARELRVSREDIAGRFDFQWLVDVRDVNAEFLTGRLKLIGDLLGIDTAGVVDRSALLHYALRSLDPHLAGMVLRPAAETSARERAEEKAALSQMITGIEPDLIEGQDHATRMQVLQEAIQSNPVVQQAAQENELFRALLENRMKHHGFMLEQQQNAQIGRVGTGEVLPG